MAEEEISPPEDTKKKSEKEILPDSEEEKFAEFLNRQIKEHPVVKEYHGKWKELIEWCDKNNQYVEWAAGKLINISEKLVKRKTLVTINLMKPLIEALDGKLNMSHQLAGSPNSSEVSDIEAAKVGTKLLAHNDYVNDIEEVYEDFKYDLLRTGNACLCWKWDKSIHGYIKSSGKPEKEDGEVVCTVPSIFNLRPDPTALTPKDMRWLIELKALPLSLILEQFPKITKEQIDAKASSETSGSKFEGLHINQDDLDPKEDMRIVKCYWERSGKEYSKGRYIIYVDNLCVYKGKNPALGAIPFWFVPFKKIRDSFWGYGPLHYLQSLQRGFNRMIGMNLEHIESWKPKLQAPLGATVKAGSFTTDAAEIVEVDSSRGDVRPIPMPELSPQVNAMRDFLMAMVDKVSNVHEVSYSQLPQYATRAPASLYSMMLEQENLKIDPLIKRLNKMIRETAKFRLELMGEYYLVPRLTKVLGAGNESSVDYFKGADLRSNYDVKVLMGVSLHQSKTVQQRLLLELHQNGIIQEPNKILKLLNLGDIEPDLRGDMADESRAQRENQAFISGTWEKDREKGGVFVYMHDNHPLHLDQHTNLSKDEQAQKWKQKDWDGLQAHIGEHMVWLQMAAQGTQEPGGPPGISPEAPPGGGPEGPTPETMAEGSPVQPDVAMEQDVNMM